MDIAPTAFGTDDVSEFDHREIVSISEKERKEFQDAVLIFHNCLHVLFNEKAPHELGCTLARRVCAGMAE
jgi:hypothetical protein